MVTANRTTGHVRYNTGNNQLFGVIQPYTRGKDPPQPMNQTGLRRSVVALIYVGSSRTSVCYRRLFKDRRQEVDHWLPGEAVLLTPEASDNQD